MIECQFYHCKTCYFEDAKICSFDCECVDSKEEKELLKYFCKMELESEAVILHRETVFCMPGNLCPMKYKKTGEHLLKESDFDI